MSHGPSKPDQAEKSFIVNNFNKKYKPDSFEEVAIESREILTVQNMRRLVKEVQEQVKMDPSILEDIWIKERDDGKEGLDKVQFYELCRMLGEEITPIELDEMLRETDFDGDGNINAEEFKRIISYFI